MNTKNNAVANDNNATVAVGANDSVYATNGTVGLNDSVLVTAGTVTVVAATVDKRIEALIAERKAWETGAMRTSNEQLYALLAKCFALYLEMQVGVDGAKAKRSLLEAQIVKQHYRFNEGTHVLTKIVKCVFGADRRRVSAYSLVLREALTQKKTEDEIAGFIASNGGVEEIRRSKGANYISANDKAELGKQAVGNSELAVASGDKLQLDADSAGNDMVAIVTQQADGSLLVRAVIQSKSVLKAALACAYAKNKAAIKAAAENSKPAEAGKTQQQLIEIAAQG